MLVGSLALLVVAAWFLTGRHLSRSDGAKAWVEKLWIYALMGAALVLAAQVSLDGFAFLALMTGFVVASHALVGLFRGVIRAFKSRSFMAFVSSIGRGAGNIFVWALIFVLNNPTVEDGAVLANTPADQGPPGIERDLVVAPSALEGSRDDELPEAATASESSLDETRSSANGLSETPSALDEATTGGGDAHEAEPLASLTPFDEEALASVEIADLPAEPEATDGPDAEGVESELVSGQASASAEASEPQAELDAAAVVEEGHDAQGPEVISSGEPQSVEGSEAPLEPAVVAPVQAVPEVATPVVEAEVVPVAPRTVEFTIVSEPVEAEILVRTGQDTLRSAGRGRAVVTLPVGEKLVYSIRPGSGSGYLQFDGEVVVNEAATHPVWLTPAPVAAPPAPTAAPSRATAPNPSAYPSDSPERTVVEWFAAYARKDWNAMTDMRLRSQRDRETAYNWLEGTYFFRDFERLISVNVRSQNEVSARVRATWEHGLGRSYVDLVLIREDSSGNPWPYAPWGVSYTSATGVRDAN